MLTPIALVISAVMQFYLSIKVYQQVKLDGKKEEEDEIKMMRIQEIASDENPRIIINHKIKQNKRTCDCQNSYGMFEGLNLKKRSSYFYLDFFFIRRFVLTVLLIFAGDQYLIQYLGYFICNMSVLLQMIHHRPFKSKFENGYA